MQTKANNPSWLCLSRNHGTSCRETAELAHNKLYGVLYPHGEPTDRGHYAVDVLHPNGDGGSGEAWLRIDDEVVSAVLHEDMFGAMMMNRLTTGVLISCFIVSWRSHGHDDRFTLVSALNDFASCAFISLVLCFRFFYVQVNTNGVFSACNGSHDRDAL
jgi:hypothetical protein